MIHRNTYTQTDKLLYSINFPCQSFLFFFKKDRLNSLNTLQLLNNQLKAFLTNIYKYIYTYSKQFHLQLLLTRFQDDRFRLESEFIWNSPLLNVKWRTILSVLCVCICVSMCVCVSASLCACVCVVVCVCTSMRWQHLKCLVINIKSVCHTNQLTHIYTHTLKNKRRTHIHTKTATHTHTHTLKGNS